MFSRTTAVPFENTLHRLWQSIEGTYTPAFGTDYTKTTRYLHGLKFLLDTFGMIQDLCFVVLLESNLCLNSKLCFWIQWDFRFKTMVSVG
jgi:hypothetical protein